ncbi:putative RAB6-interacting golgin [Helianthus annuus]|nr:putative RAB6-interacting golgin [Helianthus annuus]
MKNIATMGTLDGNVEDEKRAVEMFQAREDEIEKKKVQVREKLEFQLDRVEEKTRRLARLWEELEALKDPMKKELATVQKKVDKANHELKLLGKSFHKKVPQS